MVEKNAPQHQKTLGRSLPTLLSMAILAPTCFEPPIGISREDDSLKHSNFLSFSFWVTMLVMIKNITSIKEQLVELTLVISKLTKIIEEKKSTNRLPHEQGWHIDTKCNWFESWIHSSSKGCISRWSNKCF